MGMKYTVEELIEINFLYKDSVLKSVVEIEPYKKVSLVLKTENGTVLHWVLPYFEYIQINKNFYIEAIPMLIDLFKQDMTYEIIKIPKFNYYKLSFPDMKQNYILQEKVFHYVMNNYLMSISRNR
jgi:hypothetical protein